MVFSSGTERWVRAFRERMAEDPRTRFYPGPARLAGPIDVEGAEPGDLLEIEILEVVPAPFGFSVRPEPANGRVEWYRTDRKAYDFGSLPGARIPLRPTLETLGVLFPGEGRERGRPIRNSGCGELAAGTLLYVPARVRGAGVCAGDSRVGFRAGGPGDGAPDGIVRLIALRVTVRKDLAGSDPWTSGSGVS
jgi:acetamidase/formamidase